MRSFGLTSLELNEVKKLFQQFFGDVSDAKIYLFGSRAKGTHKPYSDIDLVIKTKSKDINNKIPLFIEAWEKSNLPYKVDFSKWDDLYQKYLPQIKKEKISFWTPEERSIHPWRICPYGKHWVKEHLRHQINKKTQDVDGHCRRNPLGRDRLTGDEIEYISRSQLFLNVKNLPKKYAGPLKINTADEYDQLIAGWCTYWNDIFKPDISIDSNFVKALMESESHFDKNSTANNKKEIGKARGLIQLTEQTLRILKDRKGEIKDHYIDIAKEDLYDPSKNICSAIRWLFRKREILQKRLGRSPTWPETIVEYKGLGPGLKNNNEKSLKVLNDFTQIYKRY